MTGWVWHKCGTKGCGCMAPPDERLCRHCRERERLRAERGGRT